MSAEEKPQFEALASRQFTSWLREQRLSLAFTTYQTGKAVSYRPAAGRAAEHLRADLLALHGAVRSGFEHALHEQPLPALEI